MTHISRFFRRLVCAGAVLALSCGGGSGGGTTSVAKSQFCDKVVAGLAKCPNAIDKANCLGKLKPFSDNDVREGSDCLRETTCDGMIQCLEEAFPGTGDPGTGGGNGNPGTGGTGGISGGPTAATCGGEVAKTTCDQCAFTSCCNQLLDCAKDASCIGFIKCISACSVNMACQMTCIAQAPLASLQRFEAFGKCSDANCAASCQ